MKCKTLVVEPLDVVAGSAGDGVRKGVDAGTESSAFVSLLGGTGFWPCQQPPALLYVGNTYSSQVASYFGYRGVLGRYLLTYRCCH